MRMVHARAGRMHMVHARARHDVTTCKLQLGGELAARRAHGGLPSTAEARLVRDAGARR